MAVTQDEENNTVPSHASFIGSISHFSWMVNPTMVIFFSLSILGSISIFFLVCLSKTFRRTSNYLVANLCVASIYHISISIMYNLQSGGVITLDPKYGETGCQILSVVHRLSTPVLPLTIAAISLDRSVVARNPQDYPSRSTAIARVVFVWAFSLVLLIPRAGMSKYDEKIKGNFKCTKVLLWNSIFLHTVYAIVTLFVIYIIPTYILVKEFFAMRCQMRFLMMSQVEQRKRFHRCRIMKNACIFTSIFIICWLPQGITQFPFDLPDYDLPDYFFNPTITNKIILVRDFFRQLSVFNAAVTPIVLLILSFDIREFFSSCCV